MKKRLIIEAAALLVLVITLLTVSAYAWFVSNDRTTAAMDIKVVGMKSVSAAYFRDYEDGAGYVNALPGVSLVDEDSFYPGKSAYCRLDIYNRGAESAAVKVSFEEVGIGITPSSGTAQDEAEIDMLSAKFVLQYVVTDFKADNSYSPDYLSGLAVTLNFLSALKPLLGGPAEGSIALVGPIDVAPGATVSVYYRFHLDETLSELSGVFSIAAGSIRIEAT